MKKLIILDGDTSSGKTTYADWYSKDNPGVAVVKSLPGAHAFLEDPAYHTVIVDPDGQPYEVEVVRFTMERRTVWAVNGDEDFYREEMGQ